VGLLTLKTRLDAERARQRDPSATQRGDPERATPERNGVGRADASARVAELERATRTTRGTVPSMAAGALARLACPDSNMGAWVGSPGALDVTAHTAAVPACLEVPMLEWCWRA